MTIPTSRVGRAFLALLLMAAMAAGVLAPVAIHPAEAAFPGANGVIAFSSTRTSGPGVNNPSGDHEIFLMKPDGSGLDQLTDNTTQDSDPAWSADGNWLAYSSGGEIYMRTDGYVDPHGFLVLAQTRRLTSNAANDFYPTFSPDGTRIAFMSDRDGSNEIYVMDTVDTDTDGNGDNSTRLTTNAVDDANPAWSPDGSKIAFRSTRDGNFEIYVMDPAPEGAGNLPVNLTLLSPFDGDPNWSPTGSRIAFSSVRDGNPEIYVMDIADADNDGNGDNLTRLTNHAAIDDQPAWSPDGTKIAFTSDRGGGDEEIYVMKAKPEGRKNRPKALTKNDVIDVAPDWQPIH
jgi:Tol biopolymer transport system component